MAPKVLIIDDDPDLLPMMTAGFRAAGFETRAATNGRLGLKLFRSEGADLVVTDIVMPEQEGIATILELRRQPARPKVIAISGGGRMANLDMLAWAGQLGADAVLPKPFRLSALIETARRLLGEAATAAAPPCAVAG